MRNKIEFQDLKGFFILKTITTELSTSSLKYLTQNCLFRS